MAAKIEEGSLLHLQPVLVHEREDWKRDAMPQDERWLCAHRVC